VPNMTARRIELYLATWMFPYWKWLVVPRTYQVVGHECDLLALTDRGYAHEIEIKISLSDVKADAKKEHGHMSDRVKCFWFALPFELAERAAPFIPERAGILAVGHPDTWRGENVTIFRKAPVNRCAQPWSYADRYTLARAVYFRYWSDSVKELHAPALAEATL